MMFNNHNVRISASAKIGNNVRIGDNTVIYDNVIIGDNSIIANDCVIGEPANEYYAASSYVNPPTVIGANALVRSHTIIYCDSVFGNNFSTGHRVTIREKTRMGDHCSVGTLSDIQGYVTFGNYCRLHSNVHIGQNSTIGNFVFIYPYVVFTNDPHPPSNICVGPTVGDYTQIAVHSVLLPGVHVGKMCLVGANTTVIKDVPDNSVVVGNPGKVIGPVTDIKSKEHKETSHYPWMLHFDRNMPWKDMGFENWSKMKENENSVS